MWCHVALVMPFLSLGLLLVLPWQAALIIYVPVAAGSAFLFRLLIRDMHKRPTVGAETLIGARATVLERRPAGSRGNYVVLIGSERWMARATTELGLGDEVEVTAIEGICLTVEGISSK